MDVVYRIISIWYRELDWTYREEVQDDEGEYDCLADFYLNSPVSISVSGNILL